MPSVRAIAEEAGVSIATVSRVMNNHPAVSESLRQRVKSAAERRRKEAAIPTVIASTVGILYTTDRVTVSSPFDSSVLQGVGEEMSLEGLDFRVMTTAEMLREDGTLLEALRKRGVGGVLIRTTSDTNHYAAELAEAGFPAVTISDRIAHPRASFIAGSSRQASREAVEHLLSIGHEKIAIVNSRIQDTDHIERHQGYCDAMAAAGLAVEPHRLIRAWPNRRGGIVAMNQIASERDRPTALFFADMAAAMGASKRAFELGLRIPKDFSLIGVDDTDLRYFAYPTMTAVVQNAYDIGRQAYRALAALIKRPDGPPQRLEAASWLEVHESTGAPTA